MGQGQGARAAIQDGDDEDGAAYHGRRDRAIPQQRIVFCAIVKNGTSIDRMQRGVPSRLQLAIAANLYVAC